MLKISEIRNKRHLNNFNMDDGKTRHILNEAHNGDDFGR